MAIAARCHCSYAESLKQVELPAAQAGPGADDRMNVDSLRHSPAVRGSATARTTRRMRMIRRRTEKNEEEEEEEEEEEVVEVEKDDGAVDDEW